VNIFTYTYAKKSIENNNLGKESQTSEIWVHCLQKLRI